MGMIEKLQGKLGIDEINSQLKELDKQLNLLQRQFVNAQAQSRRRQEQLDELTRLHNAQLKLTDKMSQHIAGLEKLITEQGNAVRQLQQQIDKLNKSLQKLNSKYRNLNREVQDLQKSLEFLKRDERIQEIQAKLARNEQLLNRIEEFFGALEAKP